MSCQSFQDFFTETDKFAELRRVISHLYSQYSDVKSIKGNIRINKHGFFTNMKISDINGAAKSKLFGNPVITNPLKKKSSAKTYGVVDYSDDISLKSYVNGIKDKAIFDFCGTLSSIHAQFKELFKSLYDQLKFYKAAIIYEQYLISNRLTHCTPEIDEGCMCIKADDVYFLPLVDNENTADIVANNFESGNDNIFLISGHNRCGKTIFVKSIGFSQLMAQAGLSVPAKYYRSSAFNYILTHFPTSEDETGSIHSLFEYELVRLHNDMENINDKSLIIMNESFSSTTEAEGEIISSDFLCAISAINNITFFVTHFYNLANNIDAAINARLDKNAHAVNLTTSESDAYKIERGNPSFCKSVSLEDFLD